jgi:hypothetical protein
LGILKPVIATIGLGNKLIEIRKSIVRKNNPICINEEKINA